MNFGYLDIEMTCDGKIEHGKFIDDGRMKRSHREIISVGFIVCDDQYRIIERYLSFIKPVHNKTITDYCNKLTGITQNDVNQGKKCNNAFRDIRIICENYSVDYIFSFGNGDKEGIIISAKWNKKEQEKADNLYVISKKIYDIQPRILRQIDCKNHRKKPSLSKIAEKLEIKIIGKKHNAYNDTLLLYKICKKLNLQKDYLST